MGKNNERGIAHLMLIIILIVAGGIGFAGWRVMSSEKDNDNTSNSSLSSAASAKEDKELEKTCKEALNDRILCKFAARSSFDLSSISYRTVMTNTDKDGKKSEIISEVDGKNNTSMVTKENGAEVYAFISLNGATYTKNAGETTWTKFPATNGSPAPESNAGSDFSVDSEDFTGKNNNISYKASGKEKCGNLTCFKYLILDKEKPSDELYIWFDTKDYIIQKYRFKNAEGSSDIVFTYKSIKISEPSPVKEFSAGSDFNSNASTVE